MSDQLPLFDLESNGNGNGRMNREEAGLRPSAPGPARLLSELVKHGLSEKALPTAAALCRHLDAHPVEDEAS